MTSKSYWARRMKMLQEGIIQERAKDVEYIERQYNRTIKEIDGKIRAWHQRLADNNGVSYAEAQKLLSKNELKDFHMTVEEYIEKGLSGGFEKELENASARVHISRLEALEMELQAHAEELTGKRIARTASAISDAYTESYYHTGYEVQQMAGVGVNMRKVDKKRLENVLARPWAADDKTFTARCWTDKNKLVNILEGELTRMVATGAAPDKAIKNIADAFNTSKANARRLVLTESAAMASVAEQDCYKELDVEEYEIVGTFDTKMCEDCASWHGQHFPRKDFKIGVNAPPFHPNCYCVTVPYFDDMAGIGERWMRNPETGKGEWIPSDMSYQDWKDIYVDKKYTLDDWKAKHKAAATPKENNAVFVAAKTKQEAEQYARERFAENVSFDGISIQQANEINQRLTELSEKYQINRLETINTSERRKTALMSARYDTLRLNGGKLKDFNGFSADDYLKIQDKRKEYLKEWKAHYENLKSMYGEKGVPRSAKKPIKELEKGLRFSRHNVGEGQKDGVWACVTHEYGHIIADQYFGQISGNLANPNTAENARLKLKWSAAYKKARKTGDIYNISEYSDKNEMEFFAECFTAREYGETLPNYIESLIEVVLKNGKLQ